MNVTPDDFMPGPRPATIGHATVLRDEVIGAIGVSSGVAVLPERVKISTSPGLELARQRMAPHVATVPASRTSDS